MKQSLRKMQIGVMGSAADLKYSKTLERQAENTGYWIAKNGAVLIFGAEKDYDSLSAAACRGAKRAGGLTVGITYGKGLSVLEKNADVVIASGLERGGGRELPLVLSCDAIITIGGGSGTLTEIAVAYQANIPIIAFASTGGWSGKLAGQYLDARKRIKIEIAKTSKEAVKKAIQLTQKPNLTLRNTLFLTAVHGDEMIGVEAMKKLEKNQRGGKISWLIANEKAVKRGVRFIDADLNRVAPGDFLSTGYEPKRAAEILATSKDYKYVVDIHGNGSKTGIFIIVTNPKAENIALAVSLPIEKVVIWDSGMKRDMGPITQFVDCGVEIECGPEKSLTAKKGLARVLKQICQGRSKPINIRDRDKKEWFKVYGKLVRIDTESTKPVLLREFKKTRIGKEGFYPLLVGQYDGVVCYKMKKINPYRYFKKYDIE